MIVFLVVIVLAVFLVTQLMLLYLESFLKLDGAAYVSSGASQSVNNGVAHFSVPSPKTGFYSYSYMEKSGFTLAANSTITVSEDVYFSDVPYGCMQGNEAVFFLYIVDSVGGQNSGNIAVGIDGSGVWSLWIGGYPSYNYIFQSTGATPARAIWYHVVLTINNSAQTVNLQVNGLVVIDEEQNQFTDKTHPVSLWIGIGEDWWCSGPSFLRIDVTNVKLEIA